MLTVIILVKSIENCYQHVMNKLAFKLDGAPLHYRLSLRQFLNEYFVPIDWIGHLKNKFIPCRRMLSTTASNNTIPQIFENFLIMSTDHLMQCWCTFRSTRICGVAKRINTLQYSDWKNKTSTKLLFDTFESLWRDCTLHEDYRK